MLAQLLEFSYSFGSLLGSFREQMKIVWALGGGGGGSEGTGSSPGDGSGPPLSHTSIFLGPLCSEVGGEPLDLTLFL